jgi:hypothetical protein
VQVFIPGPQNACLECTWSSADYRLLAAEYPCIPGARAAAPPTLSPAFVGAVVAGIMAAEAVKIISGSVPADSHEVAFDLTHRRFLTAHLRRAVGCRHDHQRVADQVQLDKSATVRELIDTVERHFGSIPVHLEVRRGLAGNGAFAGRRFPTLPELRPLAAESLAGLGFVSGDRIRVRSADRSVFVAIEESAA